MLVHNHQFASYFTVERNKFLTTENKLEEIHLFYCYNIGNFLKKVASLRNTVWEDLLMLPQGDTGQNYTMISISIVNRNKLEREERIRLPAAGVDFEHLRYVSDVNIPCQKGRRSSREDGIRKGLQLKVWGPNKILVLTIVRKVAEIHYNLQIIFEAISIQSIPFKLTGDFSFLMPILGLIKGCGSCNPSPFCTKV